MTERVDTIIIGGGQGGVSTSYHLKSQGRQHIILEQADQAASAWRKRWDSFTLVTPNWMTRLPGAEYQGDEPDGFTARDDVITYFENYIQTFDLPIRYGVRVTSFEYLDPGYRVITDQGDFESANVVIATGMFQQPKVPQFSTKLSSDIYQFHSSEYRNPDLLPDGAVLVVGSAQSGVQIAEELYQSGRKVYLSVGRAGRGPRRYRGKDITRWSVEMGIVNRTADQLPSPKAKFMGSLQGSGKDGGHSINLHQFAKDGVVLLGHVQGIDGDRIILTPDLHENLANADKSEAEFIKQVDGFIEKTGLDAPTETLPELRDGYEVDVITALDLKAAGINNIIWATGYKFDFSLVKLPVFDDDGYPVQKRGVTEYPGLYFVGLLFLHTIKSGLLFGVGDDAAHIVSAITSSIPDEDK
jgi:putative flavoprotein involved in K+ transport